MLFSDKTPSQVLAMTIRKKRKMLRSKKDRDLRIEILLTTAIRRLCQEIGDQLRSRRLANSKRKYASADDDSDADAVTVSNTVKKSRSGASTSTSTAGDGLGGENQLLMMSNGQQTQQRRLIRGLRRQSNLIQSFAIS